MSRSIAQNILDGADIENRDENSIKSRREDLANLGGYDVDVCEAAGYLHDIGHPPFGHVGEVAIRECMEGDKVAAEFEGNAQTFRIALRNWGADQTGNIIGGMNLTSATLAAVAKYPWAQAEKNDSLEKESDKHHVHYKLGRLKYNAYPSELQELNRCREFFPHPAEGSDLPTSLRWQTLEASTMDVADDITYAVHDLQDFYFAGRVDLRSVIEQLRSFIKHSERGSDTVEAVTFLARNPFRQHRIDLKNAGNIFEVFNSSMYTKACREIQNSLEEIDGYSADEVPAVERTETVAARQKRAFAQLVGKYVRAVTFDASGVWEGGPRIGLNGQLWHEVQVLKAITKKYILSSTDIAIHQLGEKKMLISLWADLDHWMNADSDRLPRSLRDRYEVAMADLEAHRVPDTTPSKNGRKASSSKEGVRTEAEVSSRRKEVVARLKADYLCTLSDNQCIALYRKLNAGDVHGAGVSEVF